MNDYTSFPDLAEHHLAMLKNSAIQDDIIRGRGYCTVTDAADLRSLGFAPGQCRVPGLLLPVHSTDGQVVLHQFRPDTPRIEENRKKRDSDGMHPNKVIKYETPKGAAMRLDCPPSCQTHMGDPKIPLWITEGIKKGDALASIGYCAVALLGVWNFKGRNSLGGIAFLADWDFIALNNRNVRIVFDNDVMRKPEVQQALQRLIEHLQRKGAIVSAVYLPNMPYGSKVGVDDWLAAGHSPQELDALVEAPRYSVTPPPEIIELLDEPPLSINRPLSLAGGHAYAATWLHAKVTHKSRQTKQGETLLLPSPQITHERRLYIVRDDGQFFGSDDQNLPIEKLNMLIHLPEIPKDEKLWSMKGVQAYLQGDRPDPVDVFNRLTKVIDRFIDFDHSLASQQVICEAIACYILTTWFLDAFQVIGFLWSNGERGSGKTQLLILIANLSYLGEIILAGGSYASLRDLADYGATLAFDDAENFASSRTIDADKRALLLAGNRRGVTVPLKELGSDKNWHTRHVNAYCPRLFSAINLPDPVLASRSIVVPLIRTSDRKRANIDPLDYAVWPYDRRQLIDDLWALSLAYLKDLPAHDEWVGHNASLTGRALQPWRALLAIAHWLDTMGIDGLWNRMSKLSVDYQTERPEFETSDFTTLILRAICVHAMRAMKAINSMYPGPTRIEVNATAISELIQQIVQDEELDIDPLSINSRGIGKIFRSMRFQKIPRKGGKGVRLWTLTLEELKSWASKYNLNYPDELEQRISLSNNGSHGSHGSDGIELSSEDFIRGVI
jgi:hypothetical protein